MMFLRTLFWLFWAIFVSAVPAYSHAAAARGSITTFEEWVEFHQKVYSSDGETRQRRLLWLENQRHVEEHNRAFASGYTSYAKSMTGPFADMTDEEFSSHFLMEGQDCSATHQSSGRLVPHHDEEVLEKKKKPHPAVDWRTKGILTAIKNQGHCGSCWTFSTSGCLEAHVCLEARKDCTHWQGLAEEQLVECAGGFNNHGCMGGLPSQAFEYLKYNGGMVLEDDYPYKAPQTGGNGACRMKQINHKNPHLWKAQVAEVFNITTYDEEDLQHAIAKIGPVSVAYQVSADFRLYAHGIYDSYNHTTNTTMCQSGPHNVNHAVVAVGLGTSSSDGTDYYIIRNSWSSSWGMEGHFWMKRGENLCGISDCASFPIVPTRTSAVTNTTTTQSNGVIFGETNTGTRDKGRDRFIYSSFLRGSQEGKISDEK